MNKLFFVVLAVAFSVTTQASTLWWTLNDPVNIDSTPTTWTTARVFASADGANFGGTALGRAWTYAEIDDIGYASTELGDDAAAKSFYIELYNDRSERIGASYVAGNKGATTYADLAKAGAINPGGMATVATGAYEFTSFTSAEVVPEPTSGLLLLIGFAGLALRRKRA